MRRLIVVCTIILSALLSVVCGQASAVEMMPDEHTKGAGTSSTELVADDGTGRTSVAEQGTAEPQAEQAADSLQPVDTVAVREPSSTGAEMGAETGAGVATTVEAADPDMRGGLSSKVAHLDTYGAIVGNYATIDGLHYDDATNRRIYNYLRASVTG